VIEERVVEER